MDEGSLLFARERSTRETVKYFATMRKIFLVVSHHKNVIATHINPALSASLYLFISRTFYK